ncbi:MAG TPA: tRNA lysidine(34) synthetase TilS [Rhodanobacteraceae bacterium]|nr:tRNA lysidine(34) synthetase TilS [Rhodanobacteraceae bacterium]
MHDLRTLPAALHSALDNYPGAPLCVAFSGGADSTVLLHALAQLARARARGLRALHVDHGLHADSARWSEHCKQFCASLSVPFEVVRAQVTHERGEGLEAAARRARYEAFAQNLRPGEWLVLAHHREDQVETVLLKLLRGAGPHGLAGMRDRRPLGQGTLWRPLLDTPRAALRDYIAAHRLEYVEDPFNSDVALSRNYLRAEILPRLHAHWPHATQSILRTAQLCRDTAEHLDALTGSALQSLARADGTLDAAGWNALPDALRALVLERWLYARNLPAPARAQLAELRRQVAGAREDHVPRVAWPGAEVRVWRGALHAMRPSRGREIPDGWESAWRGEVLQLPCGGTLALADASGNPAPHPLGEALHVRFRRGGERIRPSGDAHTRELRDLLQGAGIPPWRRARIPLVFRHGELIAVADLWSSAEGRALFDGVGAHPLWQRPD